VSEEEEVFSPSPSYSSYDYDSPQIVLDSPRITFSPLRIQDSPPYNSSSIALTPSPKMESQNRLLRGHPSLTMLPPSAASIERCLYGVPTSPISPLTPNTPLSPSPLFNVEQTFPQGFLAELYRRRWDFYIFVFLKVKIVNTFVQVPFWLGSSIDSWYPKTWNWFTRFATEINSAISAEESDASSLDYSLQGWIIGIRKCNFLFCLALYLIFMSK
jgi:hypothetical protein